MKEVLTTVMVVMIAAFLWRKRLISGKGGILAVTLAGIGMIHCMVNGFSGDWIPVTYVQRGEKGSGIQQLEFQVQVDDSEKQVTLDIPSLKYDEEEVEKQLVEFCQRLDQEILGANTSFSEVCYPLNLSKSYGDSEIRVQWQTDHPDYLNWDGKLGTDIPEEGADVLVKAELTLQESSELYQRRIRVFPSKDETDLSARIRLMAEQQNQNNEATYKLPDRIDNRQLQWYLTADSKGWILICLSLFLVWGLALMKQQKQKEEAKIRAEELDLEYPELVSRMQMLLGAGLSMRMVFDRISREYKEGKQESRKTGLVRNRKETKNIANEEIVISCRELDNGLSEAEVYRRFGDRCGTSCYRGLALLLEQNMTKGGQGLLHLLEQEALEAFEGRQRKARQQGEKVSVRLLLPMGIMLMIVLALIMIPAFMSF